MEACHVGGRPVKPYGMEQCLGEVLAALCVWDACSSSSRIRECQQPKLQPGASHVPLASQPSTAVERGSQEEHKMVFREALSVGDMLRRWLGTPCTTRGSYTQQSRWGGGAAKVEHWAWEWGWGCCGSRLLCTCCGRSVLWRCRGPGVCGNVSAQVTLWRAKCFPLHGCSTWVQ